MSKKPLRGTKSVRRKVQTSNVKPVPGRAPSPVVKVARTKLDPVVASTLVACTAGRCEFRGCNKFLYKHPLTGDRGNFAENAHIVAFREAGPRGRDGVRPADIDCIENLMLLCAPCHHLIDTKPTKYPRAELEAHKKEHEDRIKRVTGLGPAMQTTVLQLKVRIGTQVAEVSNVETAHALMPRYPAGDPKVIDLTALGDEKDDAFYGFAATRIRDEVGRLYATGGELESSKHLSVLALAPIPLLMVVGETLSNKVQTDFYQCHRDRPERWTWHEGKPVAKFVSRRLRAGTQRERVALTLSLSGMVSPSTLPPGIDGTFTVYEITLDGETPYPGCLRQREDLEAFRQLYRRFLADVKREHPEVSELHLFPAIPAPVAVSCGFDVLPKVHPTLVVYDHDRQHGGFILRLKVNEHDRK